MVSVKLLKPWIPALAWMLLIFAASTDLMSAEHTSRFIAPFLHWLRPDVSPATVAAVQLAVRKAAHVTEYAILAVLLRRAFQMALDARGWPGRAGVLLVCGSYACLDEFHQSFVMSRTASALDVVIDTCGAAAGLLTYELFLRRKRGRTEEQAISG